MYRIDNKDPHTPTVTTVAIDATDEIKKTENFTLNIRHVRIYRSNQEVKGFMPNVNCTYNTVRNGKVHLGTDEIAYKQAVTEGMEMLEQEISNCTNRNLKMDKFFLATIKVLVKVNDQHQAHDLIAETLNPVMFDWSYVGEHEPLSPLIADDMIPNNNRRFPCEVKPPSPYDEGDIINLG